MSVKNSIAPKQSTNGIVEYNANGANIKLSTSIVKNYLVSGDPTKVTDQEVAVFINLCKYQGLNPWLREAYLVKYGSSPATIVTGKDAFMKRAEMDPNYDGFEAGVIIYDEEHGVQYREGEFRLPNEKIVGGWAKAYRTDRSHPYVAEVSFDEYAGKKSDGTLNSQWSTKPGTMIRKVALVHALREAFPVSLGGLYVAEEQGVVENTTPLEPHDVVETEVKEAPATNGPVVANPNYGGDSLL